MGTASLASAPVAFDVALGRFPTGVGTELRVSEDSFAGLIRGDSEAHSTNPPVGDASQLYRDAHSAAQCAGANEQSGRLPVPWWSPNATAPVAPTKNAADAGLRKLTRTSRPCRSAYPRSPTCRR